MLSMTTWEETRVQLSDVYRHTCAVICGLRRTPHAAVSHPLLPCPSQSVVHVGDREEWLTGLASMRGPCAREGAYWWAWGVYVCASCSGGDGVVCRSNVFQREERGRRRGEEGREGGEGREREEREEREGRERRQRRKTKKTKKEDKEDKEDKEGRRKTEEAIHHTCKLELLLCKASLERHSKGRLRWMQS